MSKARLKLVEELLQLRKKNVTIFARENELETKLKKMAADANENFKDTVEGLGVVGVAAPREAACTGSEPTVDVENYMKLTEKQRRDLTDRGVIDVKPKWSKKFYGRVTVELF